MCNSLRKGRRGKGKSDRGRKLVTIFTNTNGHGKVVVFDHNVFCHGNEVEEKSRGEMFTHIESAMMVA